ncbi:MAG: hypothetical protein ACI8PZ_003820 [Myxococcota bacterium]|jgi:hypothetical protein
MRMLLPLVLLACAPVEPEVGPEARTPVTTEVAPPPGALALTMSSPIVGGMMTLSITGAGWHDELTVARSLVGAGPGPCLGALGGACLDLLAPVTLQTRVWSDEDGDAEVRLFLPADPDLVGREVCFQVVAIRGPGGAFTELGTVDCAILDRDSDGDGVADGEDPCPDDPEDGCVGGFSTDWVLQEGTLGQYTRCGLVADAGTTCIDPEIRYGFVEGGIPSSHGGNDYDEWCRQLGFSGLAATALGPRACDAPQGKVFGCTTYDELTWHWCDWSDGFWFDEALDSPGCAGSEVTEISCVR